MPGNLAPSNPQDEMPFNSVKTMCGVARHWAGQSVILIAAKRIVVKVIVAKLMKGERG